MSSSPVSNSRFDHPRDSPGRSGRRFCIYFQRLYEQVLLRNMFWCCCVCVTPPIRLAINQVILSLPLPPGSLVIEKSRHKSVFPILFKTFLSYLISSDFFFFPFRAFVLHFFIHSVSTSSGHKPKRNDQKKRGNENRRRRSDFEKKKEQKSSAYTWM